LEDSPVERLSSSASTISPVAALVNRFVQLPRLLICPLLDALPEYSINPLLANWPYLENGVAGRNREILAGQFRLSLTIK
jgi:hypothetical protein